MKSARKKQKKFYFLIFFALSEADYSQFTAGIAARRRIVVKECENRPRSHPLRRQPPQRKNATRAWSGWRCGSSGDMAPAPTAASEFFDAGVNGGLAGIPLVAVGGEEEKFGKVGYGAGDTQEIAGVKGEQRKELDEEKFFALALGNEQDDDEGDDGEAYPYEISQKEYLPNAVDLIDEHGYDVENPEEVEEEIVENVFEIGEKVDNGKVAVGHKDILVFAHAETDKGFRPAETLVEKPVPTHGDAGKADGFLCEMDFPAGFSDFLGNVAVEARADVPISDLPEDIGVESAESAGDDVVDAQGVGNDTTDHDGFQVFDCLQGGADGVFVVAHLDAAADGLDHGVEIEGNEYFLDGVAVEGGVGVHVYDVFSARVVSAAVGGTGFSAAHFQAQVGVDKAFALQVLADERGIVVGAVIDNDDFVVAVGLFVERLQEFVDVPAFVFSRNENGDQRVFFQQLEVCALAALAVGSVAEHVIEHDDNLQQVIARELHEEQEPIGIQEAGNGNAVQKGEEGVHRVEYAVQNINIVHRGAYFSVSEVSAAVSEVSASEAGAEEPSRFISKALPSEASTSKGRLSSRGVPEMVKAGVSAFGFSRYSNVPSGSSEI